MSEESAVVFVHGLFSSPAAWSDFEQLIRDDPDLRDLNLLHFEYQTPKFRFNPLRGIPSYNILADSLQTFLDIDAAPYKNLVLVTHSQGGLILQRYLARMLGDSRGRDLSRIRRIVLFACPNSGSELFIILRRSLRFWSHPQERQLRPISEEVTAAQKLVLNRIVHAQKISADQCPIPMFAYAGEIDNVVTATSARSMFPNAGVVPGDHSFDNPARLCKTSVFHCSKGSPDCCLEPTGGIRDRWRHAVYVYAARPRPDSPRSCRVWPTAK